MRDLINVYNEAPKFHPSFFDIASIVARQFCISKADLLGRSHAYKFSHPRQALCLLARRYTNLSLPQIGRKLDRDHTTILAAVRAAEKRREENEDFRDRMAACELVLVSGFDLTPLPVQKPKFRKSKSHLAADRINEYWAKQGVKANARVCRSDRKFVVKSDIQPVVG